MKKSEFKKTVSDWIRSRYASPDESFRKLILSIELSKEE